MDTRTFSFAEFVETLNEAIPIETFWAKDLRKAFDSNLVDKLVKTEIVQRLRNVSFLGAIDYTSFADNSRRKYLTSRFDHSVGVASLANEACRQLGLDEAQTNIALAAALLHDVGHGPLSHSLESTFEEAFGINHHTATAELLFGDTAKSRALRAVLDEFDVDVNEVVDLMEGKSQHTMATMFSGPINFDTIEGIARSANYRLPSGLKNYRSSEVVDALVSVSQGEATERTVQQLDKFWQLKGLIYSQLVRGEVGIVSDFKCQAFFISHKNQLNQSQFSWTDVTLGENFPELFKWLEGDTLYTLQGFNHYSIPFIKRRFLINDSVTDVSNPEAFLRNRYSQEKSSSYFEWHEQPSYKKGEILWNQQEKLTAGEYLVNPS